MAGAAVTTATTRASTAREAAATARITTPSTAIIAPRAMAIALPRGLRIIPALATTGLMTLVVTTAAAATAVATLATTFATGTLRSRLSAFIGTHLATLGLEQIGVGVVTGLAGVRARRMATATGTSAPATAIAAARTAMFRPATRILMRLIFPGLAALGARRMRAFFYFELRRLHEIDLSLEQLFDVAQIADLIG